MSVIQQLVESFRKDANSDTFFRGVARYPSWLVRSKSGDEGTSLGVLNVDGDRILELWSSQDCYDQFASIENPTEPAPDRTLEGYSLFPYLEDQGIARLNFDLHSAHSFHFKRDQVPLIGAWGRIAAVELALEHPERVPDSFAVLARHDGYLVPMFGDGDQRDLILAPDHHERNLAAIFTADDTATDFVSSLPDGATIVRMSGAQLFPMLQSLGLDGMVFNPVTDQQAVALSAAALPELVKRLG